MSSSANTGQGLAPAPDSMSDMGKLPPEVLLMICENLMTSERSHTGNVDLITVSHLNHTMNYVARKILFRDITITFTLKDKLLPHIQQWQPRSWETPGAVRLLEDSEELRSYVKNLRLRIYAFPVQGWTKESFNDIRARLKVHTDNWGDAEDGGSLFNIRNLKARNPRTTQSRQQFVIDTHTALYEHRCGWPDITPWTENLEAWLHKIFAQLPGPQHLETADAGGSISLQKQSPVEHWLINYANLLILRAAPPSFRSVLFKSWPPTPTPDTSEVGELAIHRTGVQRLQDFSRENPQITELTIDSYVNYLSTGVSDSTDATLDIWSQGLRQLRRLTTLTLSERPCAKVLAGGLLHRSRSGLLDAKLDYLFDEALVLENVRRLTLVN